MVVDRHEGALVTMVDRKSKFLLASPIAKKSAADVSRSIIKMANRYKDQVKTITTDNGKEFAYHKSITEALDLKFYFANPYASWEIGLNENTNGLLRQYFPKKMSFINLSVEQVQEAVHKLNNRPRKTLGYRTPSEVFFK